MSRRLSNKAWNFDEWFEDQHGPCPGGDIRDPDLCKDLMDCKYKFEKAQDLWLARCQWNARRTTAQWAWNIKDKQKRIRQK